MKKIPMWAIVLVAFVIVAGIFVAKKYNELVQGREGVAAAWSQVENVYQRRADLIPNLVNTVKGYAAHESSTFQAVVEARAKATAVNVNMGSATQEDMDKFAAAQDDLTAAVGDLMPRLMVIAEAYPELKADANFRALQDELAGTENRIAVERKKYNDVARAYNVQVRTFPNNIVASMFTFEPAVYFKAEEGASKAPVVEF